MNENNNSSPTTNPFTNYQLPLTIRLFLYMTRLMFKVVGKVTPKLAGNIALRLFMTPPNFPIPRRELTIRDSARLQSQEINGEKIAVRSWGEGPAVLLCHGWGGRGTQFFAFIEPLVAAGYRAVVFDAPAHGDSSGKSTNMLEVSRTISAIAQHQGPISAVIGHSFGCGTALLAISRLGLPSDKIILISCFTDTLWITEQFAEAFGINEPVIIAMRDKAKQRFANTFDTPWQWSQLSPVETIKQVDGDLLLIHDKQDTEVPYEHALKLMKEAPSAKLLTTERLGHKKILMDKTCIDACIEHIRRE
ncbi:MAG: alpha/beta hydrolase [Candidatus Thiodiazotropha sp. (ex Lucinoma borealis)]|nr:alpha/beta hydrolase [Candidatus Thiodiazotropha sp. (ex Lucinoma borealis)]